MRLSLLFLGTILLNAVEPVQQEIDVETVEWHRLVETKFESELAKTAVQAFNDQVGDMDREYKARLTKLKENLRQELIAASKQALADGNIVEANKITTALSTKSSKIEQSIVTPDQKIDLSSYFGEWTGKWGTTGNDLKLNINAHSKPIIDGPRVFVRNQTEHMELIRRGTHLIVLGWSVESERNFLRDQPDHVAILHRK